MNRLTYSKKRRLLRLKNTQYYVKTNLFLDLNVMIGSIACILAINIITDDD